MTIKSSRQIKYKLTSIFMLREKALSYFVSLLASSRAGAEEANKDPKICNPSRIECLILRNERELVETLDSFNTSAHHLTVNLVIAVEGDCHSRAKEQLSVYH